MNTTSVQKRRLTDRLLNGIETVGNKLPDPAVLFVLALVMTWIASALMSGTEFDGPKSGDVLTIKNQLTADSFAQFLSNMVTTFTSFHPLGVVLVALLGVGVAEHAGFINATLKGMLRFTPRMLITPAVILVAITSHSAADAGYVLVIPLGGIIFHAAGRHPLAGIAAAFAGVSGGFSANFVPSALDPLLQGFTQSAAQLIDADIDVNPLCNYFFTSCSCLLIVGIGWFLTDCIVEPRLKNTEIDGDEEGDSAERENQNLTTREGKAVLLALGAMLVSLLLVGLASLPANSAFRPLLPDGTRGSLTDRGSPLMASIVPLIFLLFLIPGIVYGYASGTFKNHRDIIKGMSQSMSTMGYYLVMAFFAALFIKAFKDSNFGSFLAVKGATFLKELGLGGSVTIVGIVFLTAFVNLLVGSASAKWALLGPILVPMLMQLGYSPELTQAAYRVGDSCTNIITPLMPYFPLVVVFCQRYVKGSGIGTLTSLMLPYSITFLLVWSIFLIIYWKVLGLPLGVNATYVYEAGVAG